MTQISASQIVEQALQLIDEEGLDTFSMRRLGKALEVDAKAIYYYFPGKDSLINAVLELAFQDIGLPDEPALTWQLELRRLAKAYDHRVSAHPNLVPYLMRIDGTIPAVLQLVEHVVAILERAGLQAASIVQVINLFWSFIPGFALDTSYTTGEPPALYRQLQAIPADRFPAVKRLLDGISPGELDDDLDLQLDILIQGIEALIRREAFGAE